MSLQISSTNKRICKNIFLNSNHHFYRLLTIYLIKKIALNLFHIYELIILNCTFFISLIWMSWNCFQFMWNSRLGFEQSGFIGSYIDKYLNKFLILFSIQKCLWLKESKLNINIKQNDLMCINDRKNGTQIYDNSFVSMTVQILLHLLPITYSENPLN